MKTITIKTDPESPTGTKTLTAKVDSGAVTLLDTAKPGDKITLTCVATSDKDCVTVTAFKKAPSGDSGKDQ